MAKKKAVIVGALGVIGRNLVKHLLAEGDWDVVGLSRRAPDFDSAAAFISVDLLDRAAAEAKLSHPTAPPHLSYAAFPDRKSAPSGTAV